MKFTCRACKRAIDGAHMQLGDLPLSNRFTATVEPAKRFPFILVHCEHCGLISQALSPPRAELRPRQSWIHYNEREDHLPDLSARLRAAFPMIKTLAGFGPFDKPLLQVVERDGLRSEWQDILALASASTDGSIAYLESMDELLELPTIQASMHNVSTANAIVYRYLLEHSVDPVATLRRLSQLLGDDGCVIIEVPDSTKWLQRSDYAFLWEEHLSYFTAESLEAVAREAGFALAAMYRYAHRYEDALVAVLRRAQPLHSASATSSAVDQSRTLFDAYRRNLPRVRDSFHRTFSDIRAAGKKIALVGLGHQSIFALHALELLEYIDYLIDDAPQKSGLFISDAEIPILPLRSIPDPYDLGLCLFAVRPDREESVIHALRLMISPDCELRSLFMGGPHALIDEPADEPAWA